MGKFFNKTGEKHEDIYIAILRLAKDKGIMGITLPELWEYLKDKNILTEDEYNKIIDNDTSPAIREKRHIIETLYNYACQIPYNSGMQVSQKRVMDIENYFRLLEWEELQEVRKNAKEARYLSIFAIIISVIAVFSTILSPVKIKNPIELNNEQLNRIESLKFNSNEIINKIEDINSKLESIIKLNMQNK